MIFSALASSYAVLTMNEKELGVGAWLISVVVPWIMVIYTDGANTPPPRLFLSGSDNQWIWPRYFGTP